MNLKLPSNLYYVLSLINGPMQFKLFNSDGITTAIFDLDNDESLSYNPLFSSFGFNSNLVLLNIDNTFYYLMLFPLWILLFNLLKICKPK